jgi:hypothetical protein
VQKVSKCVASVDEEKPINERENGPLTNLLPSEKHIVCSKNAVRNIIVRVYDGEEPYYQTIL